MNIQIFGTKKNFDSKKAERYFKERGIKYQFVDMKEKGLSKGEFTSVCQAVGGYEKLIDEKCKDRDLLYCGGRPCRENPGKSESSEASDCQKRQTGNGRL